MEQTQALASVKKFPVMLVIGGVTLLILGVLAGVMLERFIFVSKTLRSPTNPVIELTPTCRPRPACLDAVPKCLIPETLDMCPKQTKSLDRVCELNREYGNNAVDGPDCRCPAGFQPEIVSLGMGPCPAAGARDCPATRFRCSKEKVISGVEGE